MAKAAADVGERRSLPQPPARGHQIEEVPMPPKIALGPELFSRMGFGFL